MDLLKPGHFYFEVGLYVDQPGKLNVPRAKWFTNVPVLPRVGDIIDPIMVPAMSSAEDRSQKLLVRQVEYKPEQVVEVPYVGDVVNSVFVAIRTSPLPKEQD
jgi:hypothetical protein